MNKKGDFGDWLPLLIILFFVFGGFFGLVKINVDLSNHEMATNTNYTNDTVVEVVDLIDCITKEYTYDCHDWEDDICIYNESEYYGCNLRTKLCCGGE